MRLCGFHLLSGGEHAGLGPGDIGRGGVDLAGGADIGDRDTGLGSGEIGYGVLIIGLGAVDGDFVVGVVDLHQHIALVDELCRRRTLTLTTGRRHGR